MKKILVALLIAVFGLSVASYAATAGKVGVGIDTGAGNLGIGVAPSMFVRYNITESIIGRVGLNYSNDSKDLFGRPDVSQTGYSARVDYLLPMMIGAAAPLVGVQYSSDGASTETTIMSLILGAEVEVGEGVVLGACLVPYSTASSGGSSDSSINTGTGALFNRSTTLSFSVYLN